MISETHAEKVHSYVTAGIASGAELLPRRRKDRQGGRPLLRTDGLCRRHARHVDRREEIFGPVLSTLTFKTADEAVALANATNSVFRPASGRPI